MLDNERRRKDKFKDVFLRAGKRTNKKNIVKMNERGSGESRETQKDEKVKKERNSKEENLS